jgi:hypothetical protein
MIKIAAATQEDPAALLKLGAYVDAKAAGLPQEKVEQVVKAYDQLLVKRANRRAQIWSSIKDMLPKV